MKVDSELPIVLINNVSINLHNQATDLRAILFDFNGAKLCTLIGVLINMIKSEQREREREIVEHKEWTR